MNQTLTRHDIFIREICETPYDDTPRLIYADWLDENGEEDRAGFIRWQCAHPAEIKAEIRPMLNGPMPWKTSHKGWTNKLIKQAEIECLRIPKEIVLRAMLFGVRRGFVEGVVIERDNIFNTYIRDLAPLFSITPIISIMVFHNGVYDDSSSYLREVRMLIGLSELKLGK